MSTIYVNTLFANTTANLNVSSSTTISGGLEITGAVGNNALNVSGGVLVTGSIVHSGSTQQSGSIIHTGSIFQSGSTFFTGSIFQSGSGNTVSFMDNVGIKTISPAYALDVSGSGRFTGDLIISGTLDAHVQDFKVTANTMTFGDAASDSLTFNASTASVANNLNFDSNTFVIDSSNNRVGIGTGQPSNPLDVHFSDSGYVARFYATPSGSNAGILIRNDAAAYGINVLNGSGQYQNQLTISETMQASQVDIITLLTGGFVGIGTTTPSKKLQVVGAVSGSSFDGFAFAGSKGTFATLSGSALTVDNITLGNTAITSTAAELNLLDGSAAETIVNSKAVIYGNVGEVTGSRLLGYAAAADELSGSAATLDNITLGNTAITSTATEINLLDGSSAGTIVNSKAVIYSALGKITGSQIEAYGLSGSNATITENLNVQGTLSASNATFHTVSITGPLIGGSPVEISGGLIITASAGESALVTSGIISGSNVHAYSFSGSTANYAILSASTLQVDSFAPSSITATGIISGSSFTGFNTTTTETLTAVLSGSDVRAHTFKLGNVSVTSTGTELNLLDGSDAGVVTNSKAVIYSDAGQVVGTTVSASVLLGSQVSASLLVSGGLHAGHRFTGGTADFAVLSGSDVSAHTLKLGNSTITVTGTELNLLDGSDSATIVNSKAVVYGSAGQVTGSNIHAYAFSGSAANFAILSASTLQVDSFAPTSISSSSGQFATLSGSAATLDNITLGNTAVTSTATELNLLDGSSAETIVNSKAVIYGNVGEVTGSRLLGFDVETTKAKFSGSVTITPGSAGGGAALSIDNDDVDQYALSIDGANTTTNLIHVVGDELTTGKLARFYSNSDDNTNRGLVTIINDHASATGATSFTIRNDAAMASGRPVVKFEDTAANTQPLLQLLNSSANADKPSILEFFRSDTTADANGMDIGLIQFKGTDLADNEQIYGKILVEAETATSDGEGGKMTLSVAEHDGTVTAGLVLEDGDADGEIDVTIGAGTDSVTTISGDLSLNHDSAQIKFGADSDVILIHEADRGIILQQATETTNEPVLTLKNIGNFTAGPNLDLILENSGSGFSAADDDVLGKIRFYGDDDTGAATTYAKIVAKSSDVTNGDEAGLIDFSVFAGGRAGTAAHAVLLTIGGEDQANDTNAAVIVNEQGIDCDLRVESNDETHMLFVDAALNRVSIGDSTDDPAATLEITNHASAGASGVPLLQLNNLDVDKNCLDISAANTTAHIINLTASSLTTGNALRVDHDDSGTATATVVGMHYDFDKNGNLASTTTGSYTAFDVDMNDNGINNSNSIIDMVGMNINLQSFSRDGVAKNQGLIINVTGSDKNVGINVTSDGDQLQCFSSTSTNDVFSVTVKEDGETVLACSGSSAGKSNLFLDVTNGDIIMETGIANSPGANQWDGAGGSGMLSHLAKVNGIIETTFIVDFGQAGVHSGADINDAIAESGVAQAYFTRIQSPVNGLIFKVEMACQEVPAGTDTVANVDLRASTSVINHGADTSGGIEVINAAGNWTVGGYKTSEGVTLTDALNDYYIYFAAGAEPNGTGGGYSHGKFMVRFFGVPI
jgi:hypothetical protein